MTVVLICGALLLGYAAGRLRPAHRASNWAHWLFLGTHAPTRRDPRWWLAQVVFAGEIAVLLATQPQQTTHVWRHRNDPPPPRSAPVRVRQLTDEEKDRP